VVKYRADTSPAVGSRLLGGARLLHALAVGVEQRAASLLAFWVTIALVLTLAAHAAPWRHDFAYKHAWASAHIATLGRSFAEHGVLALGGVPIQNNGPLGTDPDAYIHWPPLLPIVLSSAFRLFGEGPAVAHGLMLVVLIANAGALGALVTACAGREAGLLSAFVFVVTPVMAQYGHLVVTEHLGTLGTTLALMGFVKATGQAVVHRAWAAVGGLSLVLAVSASWEPLLLAPGLLAAALWNRSRTQLRLAAGYVGAAVAAFALIIGVYVVQRPDLLGDLWHTVLYRTGYTDTSPVRLHALHNDGTYDTFRLPGWPTVALTLLDRLDLVGQVAVFAMAVVLVMAWLRRRSPDGRGPAVVMFAGLFAVWGLWFAAMLNHVYIHDLMMLLAAPPAAAALGICGVRLIGLTDRAPEAAVRRAGRWGVLVVLPIVLLMAFPTRMVERFKRVAAQDIAYARAIHDATEPTAVVLVRSQNMVSLYYSRRHLVRGISGDLAVDRIVPRVRDIFPGAPVYLALLPAQDVEAFPGSLRRFRQLTSSSDLILLELTGARPGR
jgi:hypothetical protein